MAFDRGRGLRLKGGVATGRVHSVCWPGKCLLGFLSLFCSVVNLDPELSSGSGFGIICFEYGSRQK